jgi:UDP-glucose 6-dehydrogenase
MAFMQNNEERNIEPNIIVFNKRLNLKQFFLLFLKALRVRDRLLSKKKINKHGRNIKKDSDEKMQSNHHRLLAKFSPEVDS